MKAFKRKPEEIVAERFDGTVESAKKIVDWMRENPLEKFVGYNLQLSEERFQLGDDPSFPGEAVGYTPELSITTEKARYYLTPGNWMVLTGEGEFKTSYDDFLAKHYDEV